MSLRERCEKVARGIVPGNLFDADLIVADAANAMEALVRDERRRFAERVIYHSLSEYEIHSRGPAKRLVEIIIEAAEAEDEK